MCLLGKKLDSDFEFRGFGASFLDEDLARFTFDAPYADPAINLFCKKGIPGLEIIPTDARCFQFEAIYVANRDGCVRGISFGKH